MDEGRAEIVGSAPQSHPNESRSVGLDGQEQVSATIILRRRASADNVGEQLLSGNFQPISRAEAAAKIGADSKDAEAVEAFVQQYGLKVTSVDLGKRSIKVEGTAANVGRAFGIELERVEAAGMNYLSYRGPLTVPNSIEGMIIAVTGLDTRPIAKAHGPGATDQ